MKISLRLFLAVPAAAGALLLSGCATTGTVATIDPTGAQAVKTAGVDIQDWIGTASQAVDSLLASDALPPAGGGRKPVLALSRVTNRTSLATIDTRQLIARMTAALTQSGRVAVSTTVGFGGAAADPMAADYQKAASDPFAQAQSTGIDYSLTGLMLEQRATQDGKRQSTYTFQLTLTDVKSGAMVWQKIIDLAKLEKRAKIGL